MKATKEQFKSYTRVQTSGVYNMFSPDAILATGLDKETYFDIIENYDEYTEKYEGEE
jgi:hypothetical protein|tara:strand:- start:234 stop:404 length:171 start_codon:yes stop_codon:yes gene_type:complete